MKSVETSLKRSLKNPVFKTEFGKIVLTIDSICPELRPFKGVLIQYLQCMFTCIESEGEQAVGRYKSYKAMFLEVVASGILPTRKFKHAIPLYRLALQFRDDAFILACLHTVFRSYDLKLPTEASIKKALAKFESQFLTDSAEAQFSSHLVSTEDGVFNFKEEIRNVVSDPAFRSLEQKVPFADYFNPIESAILLSKKGTTRFKNGLDAKRVKGYAPSIAGSSAEYEASFNKVLRDGTRYYELLHSMGNLIGMLSTSAMHLERPEMPISNRLHAELRRNVAFGNPGFKTRVIAVADYWTQYILSPIHYWSFKCLSKISADFTFSHEEGFRTLNSLTESTAIISCFDLSSATDAFPASFSREVLRQVLPAGGTLAPMWYRVMTELPFGNKWYRVGQPMGLLSSWSVFALSHHFVVWIAAKRAGLLLEVLKDPKKFYLLVGDDIVILHPSLAHYYAIIMGVLGVKINLNKSLITSSSRRVTEFVKRNSFGGKDISAISPNLIVKSFNDYANMRELLLMLRRRYPSGTAVRDGTSSYDEQQFVNLHKLVGASYKRRVISTMCSVPVVYSGLHPDSSECRAPWPPLVRINFLIFKALNILEFKIRGIYISAEGRDSFNDLTQWQLEDLMDPKSLPKSQFFTYLRKSTIEAEKLFSSRSSQASAILAEIAQKAFDARYHYLSSEECYLFEDHILSRLSAFGPLTSFTIKESERIETRSLNYKVHKLLRSLRDKDSFLSNPQYPNLRLEYLLKRFTFSLPPATMSPEEMYAKLFFSGVSDEVSSDLSDHTETE